MLKGVIFDFNGTLFFDTEMHETAWRQYARTLCGRDITDDEFRDCIHGRTNADILAYFLGGRLREAEIARHSEAKEAQYRQICLRMNDRLRLADGACELLDELRDAGVPVAVATSSGRSNTRFYWERFDLGRWFDQNTFVFNDGSIPGKPAPDIYRAAAGAIRLAPSECVVFEDMPSGIAAAAAAGAGRIIAVASSLSREFLLSVAGVEEAIPDFTGEDFRQHLLDMLNG